jgi:putative transposase
MFEPESWVTSLADAREKIEAWRHGYNWLRPYRALGHRTPKGFPAASAALSNKGNI